MHLIERIGVALFGERWQASLGRALLIHKDTVQDWRQGRYEPKPGVYVDLRRLLEERRAEIGAVLDDLDGRDLGRPERRP